jgi:hypothetical protein
LPATAALAATDGAHGRLRVYLPILSGIKSPQKNIRCYFFTKKRLYSLVVIFYFTPLYPLDKIHLLQLPQLIQTQLPKATKTATAFLLKFGLFLIDKICGKLYNIYRLYMTDGFCGLPQGSVEFNADRLGKSVHCDLICPFLFFMGLIRR